MTPAEIELASRQLYNAVGDPNWSSAEIMPLIYKATLELFTECGFTIENIYQTTSTASTGEYALPSNAGQVKRITYDGKKLFPITMRDDDTLTLQNQATTDTGEPEYYYIFNDTIFLRPIPDTSSVAIKIFTFAEPQAVTASSTLEVPTWTHNAIVDFVVSEMAAKDQNFQMAQYYQNKFQNVHIPRIKKRLKLIKRGDSFNIVQSEELHPYGTVGGQ